MQPQHGIVFVCVFFLLLMNEAGFHVLVPKNYNTPLRC